MHPFHQILLILLLSGNLHAALRLLGLFLYHCLLEAVKELLDNGVPMHQLIAMLPLLPFAVVYFLLLDFACEQLRANFALL